MFTIIVQAGGESRRMGQDKALLPFQGQPLLLRVLKRLAPIADELVVTTNTPQAYNFLQQDKSIRVALTQDLLPGRGALGGLYTALNAATHPLVAVVACDMPFINAALIVALHNTLLEEDVDIVIPHTGDGSEPFHAVYRRETCLPPIRVALEMGKWRADSWFTEVRLLEYSQTQIKRFDPELHSFINLNTPEEYKNALQLASRLDQQDDNTH